MRTLNGGRITGRKCKQCGAVEFLPVYACNFCGSTDMEWVEISGKAKMYSIVMPAPLSMKPEYKSLGKFAYGEVEIEEGARLNAVVRGMTKKKEKKLWRIRSFRSAAMPPFTKETGIRLLYLIWTKSSKGN